MVLLFLWCRNSVVYSLFCNRSSRGLFRTSENLTNSISVTKRFPHSILWIAFLSISKPIICNRSASSRCDICNSFLRAEIRVPHMLFFPVDDLFIPSGRSYSCKGGAGTRQFDYSWYIFHIFRWKIYWKQGILLGGYRNERMGIFLIRNNAVCADFVTTFATKGGIFTSKYVKLCEKNKKTHLVQITHKWLKIKLCDGS